MILKYYFNFFVVKRDDGCKGYPCGPNAKCYPEGSSHRCECDHGFEKVGSDCVGKELY